MEKHVLLLFIALSAALGFLIKDGDVVNAHAHAYGECPVIYLIVYDAFQVWYFERFTCTLEIGPPPLPKAMQGHPEAGCWWENHFKCIAPLHLVPDFT
jgi:hypothetical protein